jgi:hypothetical protein
MQDLTAPSDGNPCSFIKAEASYPVHSMPQQLTKTQLMPVQ